MSRASNAKIDELIAAVAASNGYTDGLETLSTAANALATLLNGYVDGLEGLLTNQAAGEYETVAAGQTAQVLGATGAIGDWLDHVICFPAVVACGLLSVLDGATTLVTFPGGGTTALVDCKPFIIPVRAKAVGAGWKLTTGANIAAIGVGNFT